tara:strand:- start:106 stop:1014 length:909 start_codon:yes stop_codon:yes gene_type:complete
MKKFLLSLLILVFSTKVNSNENLLTIQQQLERLQREVTDLSKSVYSDSNSSNENLNNDLISNLSAIDMRIYDIEKDVKNLNLNFEEILFQIDDLSKNIQNFEVIINELTLKMSNLQNKDLRPTNQISEDEIISGQNVENENTLGSLKLTKEDNLENNQEEEQKSNDLEEEVKLIPEEQFQLAFDNIREKNWETAKIMLSKFINENPENQLSGSAHYWLGELHILEKKHRDAALIFAEGYQKFPKSIKAPDMLYKLSLSLFEVNKKSDACNTMIKFAEDFPKHKLIKKSKKIISEENCLASNE